MLYYVPCFITDLVISSWGIMGYIVAKIPCLACCDKMRIGTYNVEFVVVLVGLATAIHLIDNPERHLRSCNSGLWEVIIAFP